jgi:hypothetical protein
VTDVSVNSQGLLAAVIAVWSTALQQHVSILDIRTWPLLFLILGLGLCYAYTCSPA